MGWVNIGDDLFKKGLVEKHKSDNHHGENYVAFAKRILLIGVNTLKLVKFGNKIGLCGELALSIGGIPVLSILLAGVTTLGLIGNGLTFWTISNDKDEVNEKINRFLDSQLDKGLSPEKQNDLDTKMNDLKVKLRALLEAAEATKLAKPTLEIENEEIGSDEELSNSDEAEELDEITRSKTKELSEKLDSEVIGEDIEPEVEYFANFSYAELKREVAIEKYKAKRANAKEARTSKKNEIRETSNAIREAILAKKDAADIIELRKQRSKLILGSAKIAAEYTAIKAESIAYRSMGLETFYEFKNEQFFSRMSELDQKRNKEIRDFACNVISIPGVVLGLVKDYSGLGGVMDLIEVCSGGLISIDNEDTMKAVISGISLVTGSSELFKFLYEENHKEELKKISAADFVDLVEVA
jgi:hypothetical protein